MLPAKLKDIIMRFKELNADNGALWSSGPLPKIMTNHDIKHPRSDFTVDFKQNALNDYQSIIEAAPFQKWTMPMTNSTLCIPFFAMEVKAPKSGIIWHAENQLAGAATHAVSTMRKLFEYAGISNEITKANIMFMDCCTILNETYYYVAYYNDKGRYVLQKLDDEVYRPGKPKEVDRFRLIWQNIFDWGYNTRLPQTKKLLKEIAASGRYVAGDGTIRVTEKRNSSKGSRKGSAE